MREETKITIYMDSWDEITSGVYRFHSITIAMDNKCFFSLPLESICCDYLKGVYANLAEKIFEIDPTIEARKVSFARNFDDIWVEYPRDQFSQTLESIFNRKLIELQQKSVTGCSSSGKNH